MKKLNVIWFRNDLRLVDNKALCSAIEDAKQHNAAVLGLFIATPVTWQQHNMAAIKQDFIRRRVSCLQQESAEINFTLLAVEGTDYHAVLDIFSQLAQQYKLKVFIQTDYELDEIQRDNQVEACLNKAGGELIRFDSQCIMPPGSILNQQGAVYKVFTPFKRKWLSVLFQQGVHCLAKPAIIAKDVLLVESLAIKGFKAMNAGDCCSKAWPVEQAAIIHQLRTFCQQQVADYAKARDYPAVLGTSKLSAYLAIGAISAAQCVARLQLEAPDAWALDKTGAEVWLSELIWREFYKHILLAYPNLIKHKAFQVETDAICWSKDEDAFNAWCSGNTGYPIVDAAMRQLNQTGWMHNRLRMITASFLVKDLHIDWRWGERYFMSKLIDGDFSANNGGWQWAASTGTDAVPYFRIFNPVTQSERFDPSGDFIRHYVPELAMFDAKTIHWPHKNSHLVADAGYVKPIVDHAQARKVTLALFAEVKQDKD
ncbi:deoxyribodipyrimidine photo-lyase [Rheinheimera sp. MMS21-TC3]|uniref:deoxyribodipyrimidine photo-lyase n=1 Tax=Rheinheimera sp. MMS21-TC3 TaxID=3072790 RepID=UPI0028C43431|nr:deoxyribodipyrimidine photo-lyase [Rheinheimera sp. MMS21-TC3]WNO60813.1 deoxyribodipyrimidine photo-lyase [Rheinheimera sp. MMS21-TC3]